MELRVSDLVMRVQLHFTESTELSFQFESVNESLTQLERSGFGESEVIAADRKNQLSLSILAVMIDTVGCA